MALLSPLVALGHPEVFTALAILNGVVFTALWMRQPDSVMGELALLSLLAAVAGMPIEWNVVLPGTRLEYIGLAAAAYVVIHAIRSSSPEAGLIGALAAGLAVAWLTRSWSMHAGLQPVFVFLLVHSLRWPQGRVADAVIRNVAACAWIIDALLWTREGWFGDSCYVAAGAVMALSFWGFYYWRQKQRPSLIIPISAGATALSGPMNWFIVNSSPGLVALVASFLLFALGAVLAFTKHKWDRNGGDVSQPAG